MQKVDCVSTEYVKKKEFQEFLGEVQPIIKNEMTGYEILGVFI